MTYLIFAHIVSGSVAVIAGALALGAPKGRSMHILCGRVFFGAMTVSSALGAALGLLRWEDFYITFHAGVLALTLIGSGWLAARGEVRGAGSFLISVINATNLLALAGLGAYALRGESGAVFGFPAEDYFFLSGMAALAAFGDVTLLWRRRISDRFRIARHLWRMCFGFFIAAGSAFTGPGASAFPESVRQSGVLSLPELLIFVLMLFWLTQTVFFSHKARVA